MRLRSHGGAWLVLAFVALVVGNGFGAHRAVFQEWGYPGVVVMYVGWICVYLMLARRVRYRVFDTSDEIRT